MENEDKVLAALAAMETRLTAAFDAKFDEKLGGLERRFDEKLGEFESRVDGKLGAQAASLDFVVSEMNKGFARVYERLDAQDSVLESHGRQLTHLNTAVADIYVALGGIREELSTLTRRMEELERRMGLLASSSMRVRTAEETKILELSNAMDELRRELRKCKERIEIIERDIRVGEG